MKNLSRRSISIKLLTLTVIVSVIHHIDHILRVDHSGWPFVSRVSPFTYSLLVYPVLVSIYLARPNSWYRVVATAFLFLFATTAHIFFEPLRDKYHTWAFGSNLPGHIGEKNLLGLHSKILGVVSLSIAVILSVLLLATLLFFIKDVITTKRKLSSLHQFYN